MMGELNKNEEVRIPELFLKIETGYMAIALQKQNVLLLIQHYVYYQSADSSVGLFA